MDARIPVEMIAPCGISCAVCYAHLRKKRTCPGCRGQVDSQPGYCRRCKIRGCALSRGIDFCSVCSSFPCPPVKQIDKRYRLSYQVSLIENGIRIKTSGTKQFLREDKQKWTCAQCGGTICLHTRICSDCGKEMEHTA
jgi:hypothetical protein